MAAALAAVIIAIGIYFLLWRDDDGLPVAGPSGSTTATTAVTQEAATGSETSSPSAQTGEAVSDAAGEASSSDPVSPADEAQQALLQPDASEAGESDQPAPEVDAVRPPSFDVVRVEKTGEAVIAGQAPPGSDVTIFDNEETLGTLVPEPSGAWVFIPAGPLAPGTHDLSLLARLDDGRELRSEDSVVIVVPEPEMAVAAVTAQPSGEDAVASASQQSGALVVVVPGAAGEASTVLQQPETPGGEGLGDGDLVLRSIDYDDDGNAVISGSGAAGARVLAYLDDKLIGAATIDQDGEWVIRPRDPIAPGLHRLRIDQLGPDGSVVARVESPFSRAAQDEVGLSLRDGSVVVQPGNSLWRIARRVYGRGVRYSVIYEANTNQIRDPDLIYPGQIFTLPQSQE
jgi:nucleoid-associated protein YgaU